MGQAKRRSQLDPTHGTPAIYTLCLFDKNDDVLTEIPMPIRRLGSQKSNNSSALSIAGAILSYLIMPIPPTWSGLSGAIAKYTSSLHSTLDLEAIKDLPKDLPEHFWAWVTDEDDQQLISKDEKTGATCIVTFASREGVAPAQPGVKMRRHEQQDFVKQII